MWEYYWKCFPNSLKHPAPGCAEIRWEWGGGPRSAGVAPGKGGDGGDQCQLCWRPHCTKICGQVCGRSVTGPTCFYSPGKGSCSTRTLGLYYYYHYYLLLHRRLKGRGGGGGETPNKLFPGFSKCRLKNLSENGLPSPPPPPKLPRGQGQDAPLTVRPCAGWTLTLH